MLPNPFRDDLGTIPGTPFLEETGYLDFIGAQVPCSEPGRIWTIQSFLAPSFRRAIAGLRAKLYDQKGFITFVNQRDLEVLLGLGFPGSLCRWWGRNYLSPDEAGWIGLCADEEDLRDDLFERESFIRQGYPQIPEGLSLQRRIHIEAGMDAEETWIFLRETDGRHETILRRWVRAERVRITWDLL